MRGGNSSTCARRMPALAHQALAFFNRLYAIEHDAAALSPEARRALRQTQSVPILNDMHAWFNEQLCELRPKSPVTGAIKYSLKNWDALCRFTSDGNIPIDNNRSERTLRATKPWDARTGCSWGATTVAGQRPYCIASSPSRQAASSGSRGVPDGRPAPPAGHYQPARSAQHLARLLGEDAPRARQPLPPRRIGPSRPCRRLTRRERRRQQAKQPAPPTPR